jgi:hypothetical protein
MISRVSIVAIREHIRMKKAEGKHPNDCRVVEEMLRSQVGIQGSIEAMRS